MLADLNVSAEYQREVVASSSRLGFDCVAAAVQVTGRLQEKDRHGMHISWGGGGGMSQTLPPLNPS